jgi:nitrate reductase (NAD(P)H)
VDVNEGRDITMTTITQLQSQSAVVPAKYLIPIISNQPGKDELLPPQSYGIPLPPPSNTPTKVLDIDKDTPDRHVPRDPRLIRLTGVHPLNVEAPLTALYDEGIWISETLVK